MTLDQRSARRTLNVKAAFGTIGLVFAAVASAQDTYDLSWYTINAGGVMSSGDYEQACVIGQAAAGETGGGDYSLTAGFLIVPSPDVLYYTGFEPEEGFAIGGVNGQNGWLVSGSEVYPIVSSDDPASGVQHLRFLHDADGSSWIHAYSPDWGPLGTVSTTTSVDVEIGLRDGSVYFIVGENPSHGAQTWQVAFEPTGEITVFDNGFVTTNATWTESVYGNLTVCDDPAAGTTEYYYDGAHIHSQQAHMPGTAVEQVRIMSNNQPVGRGDFDNLLVLRGLSVPGGACTPPLSLELEPTVQDGGFGTRVRYLSFAGGTGGASEAVRVTFDVGQGQETMWVGEPLQVSESSGDSGSTPVPVFWAATLQCHPHFTDWSTYDSVHVYGASIIPSETYNMQLVTEGCEAAEVNFSTALPMATSAWGDLAGVYDALSCRTMPNGYSDCWTSPDGDVDFDDITGIVDKFKNLPGAPHKSRGDIAPDTPDRIIDFVDIPWAVDAFRGLPYPWTPPAGPCGP